jgi:hypothetical protein
MYAQKFECPGCSDQLSAHAKKCSCGWRKSENSESRDPRCNFILNGKRCPMAGTMSSATHKSDDWKCSYHFENRDDFYESSRWLDFIKNQFHEIIHFRKHFSTNVKNCDRCQKLCDVENDFSKNENKGREEVIY